jgi:hypothetical protein
LENRIDSLEKNSYKPGFGEFMTNIQIHHAKLWFAGINENWNLADFEIGEIKESLEAITKYETDRKESRLISMIYPVVDSINNSIQSKNLALFKKNYLVLTNTCNNCHKSVNFNFNVVKVPDNPPFTNQKFKADTLRQ